MERIILILPRCALQLLCDADAKQIAYPSAHSFNENLIVKIRCPALDESCHL